MTIADAQEAEVSEKILPTPPPIILSKPAELKAIERASLALGLAKNFTPRTDIMGELKRAKLKMPDVIVALRNSSRDEAKVLMEKFELLSISERKAITLDHLLAATGIDVHAAMGAIVESISRQGASISTLIIAAAHPKVTEKTIQFAQRVDGFQDRKLLHQSIGTTPVPKNQSTIVNMRDMKNTNVQMNGIPTLESIGKVLDAVTGDESK